MNKRCTVSLKGIKTGQTEQISECAAAGWVIFPLSLSYTHTHTETDACLCAHTDTYTYTQGCITQLFTRTHRETRTLYRNERHKVDHHLQGGTHNNNPRELTQVSEQSPRVDKPNNAKLTRTSRQTAGTRSTRRDRQTERARARGGDGRTDRRTDGRTAATL